MAEIGSIFISAWVSSYHRPFAEKSFVVILMVDKKDRTHLKLLATVFLWASSYPLGRILASYEVPSVVVVTRLLVAFVFLICLARWRGELKWPVTVKQLALFFLLGFAGFCTHNYLMFKALEHTQASTGAVINGAIPIIVVLLDYLVFRRTVSGLAIIGILVGIAGTAIVVTHGDIVGAFSQGLGLGELLFLVAITGWAVYSIAVRPLFESLSPIMITAYTCLTGAILLAPAALHTLPQAVPLFYDWQVFGLALGQAIFVIGLGFLWFYEGVKSIGPARASVYINLVPVFAIILSAITIGEKPHVSLYIGAALILSGLFIVNYFQAKALLGKHNDSN